MELPVIEYVPDEAVGDSLDRSLRNLLVACFTGTPIFRERRFYHEVPAHRWLIRGQNGEVVAHVAAHEKRVFAGGEAIPIGGIAEVCVDPAYRGQGYVRGLLEEAHSLLRAKGMPFSVLFGESRIYSSSGYVTVKNLYRDFPEESGGVVRRATDWAMVLPLAGGIWPEGEVYLPGPTF